MHGLEALLVERLSHHRNVDGLSPCHAKGPRGPGGHLQNLHESIGRNGRPRQEFEAQGLQGIAHEQGRGLIVGNVHGGLATTQVVVVHAGHVVVNQ